MINTTKPIIGIDIGGVIISRTNDGTDTSFFGANYLKSAAVAGAYGHIANIAKAGFEVHLVSKCGPNTERKSKEWLAHHDFYGITSVSPENVHFCRERKDKAIICRDIGATYFVDDRLEVLSYLETVEHRYLFDPVESEVEKHSRFRRFVTRTDTWDELEYLILESVSSKVSAEPAR